MAFSRGRIDVLVNRRSSATTSDRSWPGGWMPPPTAARDGSVVGGSTSRSGLEPRPGTASACSTGTSCCTKPDWSPSPYSTVVRRMPATARATRRAGSGPRWLWTIVASWPRRWVGCAASLKYRPLVFELLPDIFTLFQLQRTVEALVGVRLHKQNFRRLVERGGLVEGTGRLEPETGGRPAELFRFRREVLLERPAPGVGLPGLPARH